MFYLLLLGGVFLIAVTPYIFIKTQKTRNANTELKKVYKGILAIFLIGVGFVGVAFIVRAVDGPAESSIEKKVDDVDAWKTKDNKTMAYVMMQNFVKDRLKSPGSAKFEWITEPTCTIEKDEFEYRISSWVDSQNTFGAMIRTRFSGIVRQVDKDNWELVSLIFPENIQESTNQNRMTIQEFVDAYNYNAPGFRASQNNKWDIKEMEKINSIDLIINETAKAVITFEKVPPYYLNGFMFYISGANNAEIRAESIGALFSMIGTFEPGKTYNEMEKFINSIFAQEHGKEIELPHGAKCTVLDLGNVTVFSVGYE
ncbi:MAG: hypothetical protein LBK08_04155 [Treponema sp.]|jgi:hypothetical protein|nr:hypothetical protein [Treponema sp.]